MNKKTFIGYFDRLDYMDGMGDEHIANLFKCILEYANAYKSTEVLPEVKFIWNKIKKKMDEDLEKRNEISDKRRDSANNRRKNKDMQMHTNGCKSIQKHYDNENDNVNVNDNVNKNNNKEIIYFDNQNLNDIFLKFIKHRKEIKQEMKQTTIELNIKKINNFLKKYSIEQVIEIIETSITNGRQGLFEPKVSINNPPKNSDVKPDWYLKKEYDELLVAHRSSKPFLEKYGQEVFDRIKNLIYKNK